MPASRARTTQALITNAVAAAQAAGIEVGAVEVAPGGIVRILAREVVKQLSKGAGGNSCDEIFGGDHE